MNPSQRAMPTVDHPVRVRCWGARGSIPTPLPSHMGFGGNTSCLALRIPGVDPIVFDAGTGLRMFGDCLLEECPGGVPPRLTLLLSHLHWDHIQGLPFFRPLYRAGTEIAILVPAGETANRRAALAAQFQPPFFPVSWDRLPARIDFHEIPAAGLERQGVRYYCRPLNHPQKAYAFRLEWGHKVFVHALDHEHGDEAVSAGLAALAAGADLLVGDSQYTPEEYQTRRGWGHSTWPELVALARRAGVRRLLVSHHDPDHDDAALAVLEHEAQAAFPACIFAREGLELEL